MPKRNTTEQNEEVFVGDQSFKDKGQKPKMPFDADFGDVNFSDLDRILDVPGMDDIGGTMARWNIKDDEDRKAYLMTIFNCINLGMKDELQFILHCGQSTLGSKAFGKTLQLQGHIGMAMPGLMGQQIGVQTRRKEEKVRRSDYVDRDEEDVEYKERARQR